MAPSTRGKLDPWIENLIVNHGTGEEIEGGGAGRLKAHVVEVGKMSQSQALGSEGPTWLLFLSDGVVQIPAILTASAWEYLQEQDDRECFSSLVNTTVHLRAYQLDFHMATEPTRCRFFLTVRELTTTSAGPVTDTTPSCTSLPSVRMKIVETRRALLGQEEPDDTQMSQYGLELSELLGDWQQDCLQDLLEDVRQRLTMAAARGPPASPRPSTSSHDPSLLTGWDADRVRYKGEERLDIPVAQLIVPDEEPIGLRAQLDEGSEMLSGLLVASEERIPDGPLASQPPETVQPFAEEFTAGRPNVSDNRLLLQVSALHLMSDSDDEPSSNPWDIFPPPCDELSTSDYDASLTRDVVPFDPVAVATSTQIPVRGSGNSPTLEQSKGEHSFFPPYQKLQPTSSLALTSGSPSSTPVSAPDLIATFNPSPGSGGRCSHVAPRADAVSDRETRVVEKDAQEEEDEEVIRRKDRNVKWKRGDAETLEEEEEVQMSLSPPTWLFETQAPSREDRVSSWMRGNAAGSVRRKRPAVHSDNTRFSYRYEVSGRTLQDLSRFRVSDDLVHWAVKYLVPKQTNNTHTHQILRKRPKKTLYSATYMGLESL